MFQRGGQPKEIYVPLSDETCVIIPSNIKGTGFLKNLYKSNRQYLGGLISRKDFDNIVEGCAKLTALVYSHNRKKDVEGIPNIIMFFLALSSCMMISFIFLLYYGIRDDNTKSKIAGFFMLGISVGITTIIGLINFFSRPDKYSSFKEMVKKALTKYFLKVNQEYENRGLFWDIYDNHYWIEVRIDKHKSEAYRKQIHYNPNVASDSEGEEEVKA